MKIIDNRKEKTALFETLKAGECFLDLETEELMMKLDEEEDNAKAVHLESGKTCYYCSEHEIYPIKAYVIID